MTKERLSGCSHPVLQAVCASFTEDQLMGHSMPIHKWSTPTTCTMMPQAFDRLMAKVGWMRSEAWKVWFLKIVAGHLSNADVKTMRLVQQIINGSALETFRNFSVSLQYHTSQTPVAGDIVFWQYGHSWMGHTGIVLQVLPNGAFVCLEPYNYTGEENDFRLVVKTRKIPMHHRPGGLNLLGFVSLENNQ